MRLPALVILLTLGTFVGKLAAGYEIKEARQPLVENVFERGKVELQLGAGMYSSFQSTNDTRPGFTDVDMAVRVGAMCYSPRGEGIFRGNCEFLVEAYGAALVEGPRTGYAGVNVGLRYNFVQPDAWIVPYFQIHAGAVYDDVYQDGSQRVFGRAIEFDLGGGLGVRFLWTPTFALFAEVGYRHISNADTADRNLGLNSIGGLLGVSLFY